MKYYVDTSAMVALVVANDRHHDAAQAFVDAEVVANPHAMLTTASPAVVESLALLQARIGMPAVREFTSWVLPRILVEHLDHQGFMRVLTQTIADDRRSVSFVDHVGFDIARTAGCDAVFAFDEHFVDAGFVVVP